MESRAQSSADRDLSRGAPILVTGGTGFIGRHVVARLLAGGHRLRIAHREQRVPPEWRNHPDIALVHCADLTSESLEGLVVEGGSVVHMAGLAGLPRSAPNAERLFDSHNAQLTARLVEAARRVRTTTFVHLSSIFAVTGNATAETVGDLAKAAPDTPYGVSKRAAERHVRKLAEAGVFAVTLRPPLVIGADAKGNWAALQKLAATGLPLPFAGIANRRSFISVQSLAEAIALLCSRPWPTALSGEYGLADPGPLSLPEVLTELRAGMGLPPNLFFVPPRAFDALGAVTGRRRQIAALTGSLVVDASRFGATFGFAPPLSIREALRRSGAEYRTSRRGLGSQTAAREQKPTSPEHPGAAREAAKRVLDISLALIVGILSLPVMLLAMAAIRLTSPGPALFRQVRVGRNEAPFVCLKLRTMRPDTADLPSHEVSAAAVTPVGRFLRRTKLDELPQLWNILVGEMSFVGPRPCLPSQKALIEARRAHGLYALRPGITGVAQVAGVDMSDPARLAELDATYLADRSIARDLKLIAATFLGAGRGDRVRT